MVDAGRVSTFVTQAKHGFARGQCVKFDGTNWILATVGVAGIGVVGSIQDANSFEFIQLGLLEGLDGLTPGATYYPSATGISTTPNGNAVGTAYTETTLFLGSSPVATSAIDVNNFVTQVALTTAIASEVVRTNATMAAEVVRANATYVKPSDLLATTKVLTYTGSQLTSIVDSKGSKTLSYDVNGNLVSVVGTGLYQSKTYVYTAGVLTSITVP